MDILSNLRCNLRSNYSVCDQILCINQEGWVWGVGGWVGVGGWGGCVWGVGVGGTKTGLLGNAKKGKKNSFLVLSKNGKFEVK
jgi:hypothetical protein